MSTLIYELDPSFECNYQYEWFDMNVGRYWFSIESAARQLNKAISENPGCVQWLVVMNYQAEQRDYSAKVGVAENEAAVRIEATWEERDITYRTQKLTATVDGKEFSRDESIREAGEWKKATGARDIYFRTHEVHDEFKLTDAGG